jgi:hypothetical protein
MTMIPGVTTGARAHSRRPASRPNVKLAVQVPVPVLAAMLMAGPFISGCGSGLPPISNGCEARYLLFTVNGRKLESSTCTGLYKPLYTVTVKTGAVITAESLPQPQESAIVVSSARPGTLHGGPARIGGNRAERFTAIRAGNADLTVPGSCPDLASTMPDPAAPCVVLRVHVT